MLHIKQNYSLQNYNTFRVDILAKQLITVENENDVLEVCKNDFLEPENYFILGGGSNILFTNPEISTVIKNEIKGFEVLEKNDDTVVIRVGSGEDWHQTVLRCAESERYGLENLALIPGTVGAAPVQNIGAYGVEAKDLIVEVEAIELFTGEKKVFSNEECLFGYRSSIFKKVLKQRYFITSVSFKLSLHKNLNLSYKGITDEIAARGLTQANLRASQMVEIVSHIRKTKLPDHHTVGTAGSFFQNPIVSLAVRNKLEKSYPDMPRYPIDDSTVKLSAGWLVEQAGFKGYFDHGVGTHKAHALILIHDGSSTGKKIWEFAQLIQQKVKDQFAVELVAEVNVL
ncbi:MAG TPA: UDP-N-acetylmuramate dehydrogenase [Candidatus Absconditabacterales bacterium]|nr:UDP-N-acetylmuramate dehydrogenase [Candidatus Absconditabacterales bacterium]